MGELTISHVKQQLQQELGPENFRKYLALLKEWFGQRMTKYMFDFEVETLFSENCFILHNQLIHCVLLYSFGGPTELASSYSSLPALQSSKPSTSASNNLTTAGISHSREITLTETDESINRHDYITSPLPGEEPFLYPPNTREYTGRSHINGQGLTDLMEQDPPPDCDWLKKYKITFPTSDENHPDVHMKHRFPPWFAADFQPVNRASYTHEINIVRNVTHVSSMVRDLLERKPHLKQHFVVPCDKKTPYLTSGCSLYGRILTNAWDRNIQNVNLLVTEYAVKAVKDNVKSIIVAMLKQRRPFRMRDKRILHSVGVPYPNPYLRQGQHMYDETYGSDTTKMADVVMQVPAPFPTLEEKERLAALQVAASYLSKDSKFTSAKGSLEDLLQAIKHNPSLIPDKATRYKLIDKILRSCKGFGGSHNSQYVSMEDDDDIVMQSSPVLPVASY